MVLKSPAYNPVPGAPKSGLIEAEVGIFLRYAHWRSRRSSGKGTVILLQGRSEYIEKNYETVQDLIKNGYDVLSFDWRGQGGSSRLLEKHDAGYVDSFDEYATDLLAVISQIGLPDCRAPLHILAHSTGSLAALLAAPQIGNKIDRMVLCSPLLGVGHRGPSERTVELMSGLLSAIGLGEVYLSGRKVEPGRQKFEGNVLTSDEKRFRRNSKFAREFPDLCIGGATASWVFAMCKAFERTREPEFVRSINVPILIIAAGLDEVVNNRSAEKFSRGLRIGRMLTIDGARHEIWQERDGFREQFLAAFMAFVPGSSAIQEIPDMETFTE